ncbi:hypothetical protein ABTC25_12415 [Acinetobacter baumannii]|nr:hypothetical protein [Acinetobacter baumannii]
MTDLNKEREVNLRFEQDDGVVWVFDGDSQFGTEISHLMMMHSDEYNEDELRVICHHAACEIDRLRAELEKEKASANEPPSLMVQIQTAPDLTTLDALEIDVAARDPQIQPKLMGYIRKRRYELENPAVSQPEAEPDFLLGDGF